MLEILILTRIKAASISSVVRVIFACVLVNERAAFRSSLFRDLISLAVMEVSGTTCIWVSLVELKGAIFWFRRSSAVVVGFSCFCSLQDVELEELWVLVGGFVSNGGRRSESRFKNASVANGKVLCVPLGRNNQPKDTKRSYKLIIVSQKWSVKLQSRRSLRCVSSTGLFVSTMSWSAPLRV